MIPARYDESTRSAAERRLFDRLARDPDTEGWVVLHRPGAPPAATALAALGAAALDLPPDADVDAVIVRPDRYVAAVTDAPDPALHRLAAMSFRAEGSREDSSQRV